MSCWVVPSVAAEYWNVPLEHVEREMHAGRLPCKLDQGFIFIDVAPNSPVFAPRLKTHRPPTYRLASGMDLNLFFDEDFRDDWRDLRARNSYLRQRPMAA